MASVNEKSTLVENLSLGWDTNYSITGLAGSDGAKFSITNDGVLSFLAAPNFEAPNDVGGADGDNFYTVNVRYQSGWFFVPLYSEQLITVEVKNINEVATLSIVSATPIAENVAVRTKVADLDLSDPDSTATDVSWRNHTYTVDDPRFEVGIDGDLYLKAGQITNFEGGSSINVKVTATDTSLPIGGRLSVSKDVIVTLTDVNEKPIAGAITDASIAENTAGVTILGTATATDPDAGGGNDGANNFENLTYSLANDYGGKFAIDSGTGVITATGPLNFEEQASYTLTAKATDGGNLFDTKAFTVNVIDVFEGGGLIDPNAPVDPGPGVDPNAPFDGDIAALVVSSFVNGKTPVDAAKLDALSQFAELQFASYTSMGVANPDVGPYEALGRGLSTTAEFKAKYDALGEDAFIAKVYNDVLGRAATTAQVDHFQAQIDYFQGIYKTANIADTDGTLYAKGAVLGQILSIAVLAEADDHSYAGAANAFLADAKDGQIQWGLPLSHWDVA